MDNQERARLLGELLEERLDDDGVLSAIYERLAKRHRCKCLPGSLCELEMIERYFKGKKSITVHVLADEGPAVRLDEKGAMRAGASTGQTLEGDQFLIEKGDYEPPTHSRNVRSVRSWIRCQFALMRGCLKPWIKNRREDPALPVLHSEEFVRRYFFAGMEWDKNLIQQTYFNVETRRVFFHFRTQGS